MQIPSIRNFVTSRVDYFFQSSWKGKTVHVLCAASILALIYFVAFRKKTPPKEPEGSSPLLNGRVDKKPPAQSTEPPKPDLSYIKPVVKVPNFKQAEFSTWLSEQMKSYDSWHALANGSASTQPYFLVARRFVTELRAQVNKMFPVFQRYSEIKTDDFDVFCNQCDSIVSHKITASGSCAILKSCLDKLKAWNDALLGVHITQLMQQVGDVKICPHYEFTNLQTQYFDYLGLHTKKDFSNLLSTEIDYLATVGLLEMEDVDCLQLRAMMPSIERLRQLFCVLKVTGDEKAVRSLIEKEIESCRDVLTSSDNISDELKNDQKLKDNVKLLRGLFGDLSRNFDKGLTLLKEIEQKDIERQLILLWGYIHQQDHRAAWTAHNEMGFTRLALYAKALEANTLKFFYQMGK